MSPQAKKVIENKNTLTFSEDFARTVLDSLSAHISILDQGGTILETNLAWRKFAIQNGFPKDYDGKDENHLDICDAAQGDGAEDAQKVTEGIEAVIEKEIDEFLYDYPCHGPDGPHW